ncbi:MAG: PAS domain S-box protein [Oscillochloris sp.]|nr:PAS domain S-box protein [Oscillochloris sp.]
MSADQRSRLSRALVDALVDALETISATPLCALLDSDLLPTERPFADTQDLLAITRRSTLNLLRPLIADRPDAGVALVDCLGELLGAAREAEVNWQIQNAQSRADAQAAELRTALYRMQQSFDASPLANIEADTHGIITRWNHSAERIFGWSSAEAIGCSVLELLVPNIVREHVEAIVAALLSGQAVNSRNVNITKNGREITCQWYNVVLYNTDGSVVGWLSQTEDITEQLRAEQERVELQEQVIEAQRVALRELSTPIIPIGEGVVAMPLIGNIDSTRAQLVIETLLEGVAASRARSAILDITGVQVVDTQVANALLRAAQAVKLLGSQVIITGIRPEVAQTLVGLGLDLSGIKTLSTLQAGIAHAFSVSKK